VDSPKDVDDDSLSATTGSRSDSYEIRAVRDKAPTACSARHVTTVLACDWINSNLDLAHIQILRGIYIKIGNFTINEFKWN